MGRLPPRALTIRAKEPEPAIFTPSQSLPVRPSGSAHQDNSSNIRVTRGGR